MEISRVTKFLLDRGANASSKLTSTHYRRSPLVLGGIEIPCVVIVSMLGNCNSVYAVIDGKKQTIG